MAGKSIYPDFQENWIPDPEFFGRKPSPHQDRANKRNSQIGPAVTDEIGHKHRVALE